MRYTHKSRVSDANVASVSFYAHTRRSLVASDGDLETLVPVFSEPATANRRSGTSRCSALVKFLEDKSDIFAGHWCVPECVFCICVCVCVCFHRIYSVPVLLWLSTMCVFFVVGLKSRSSNRVSFFKHHVNLAYSTWDHYSLMLRTLKTYNISLECAPQHAADNCEPYERSMTFSSSPGVPVVWYLH